MIPIPIVFTHDPARKPRCWPVTRGVPLPEGMLPGTEKLRVLDHYGVGVPAQFRVLARWPDGTIKWVLVDFQADAASSGRKAYLLSDERTDVTRPVPSPAAPTPAPTARMVKNAGAGHPNKQSNPGTQVRIEETESDLLVDTGAMQFRVDRHRYGLFHSVSLAHAREKQLSRTETPRASSGDAWARISEGSSDGGLGRRLYGPGGLCRASLAGDSYAVSVEERGPLRAVIRLESALEADIPMHHYGGYRPVRCITRIHAYAGHAFVRLLQTHVFTCNPREVEIEDLALDIPAPFSRSGLQYAIGSCGDQTGGSIGVETGTLDHGERLRLAQKMDNHVQVVHGRPGNERTIAEHTACEGWAMLDDGTSGVGVACRNMAEEYPGAIELSGDGRVAVYARHDPDGGRLSLSRYAEEVAWHEGEGVYADGTGIAKTTEFFVHYFTGDQRDEAVETMRCALSRPHASVSPDWMAQCEVAGGFLASPSGETVRSGKTVRSSETVRSGETVRWSDPGRRDEGESRPKSEPTPGISPEVIAAAERMLTGFADWLARNIRLGRWYGYLDYGDVRVSWDDEDDDWKSRGRWGWCNSEWDPRHAVWIQYLRTGDARYFELGEAMTRHSMDVDTCHWHPFRPYMVGGCFRHGVGHFGDEPCASHTFIDNWIDYYYLTGDGRTLETIREAGAFFLRYRWTEDPAFSFSLRSIANVLRGLLYVYEATGEDRYLRRAEEVYTVLARGQNDDGSWHKRFQVATPDRLPAQLPYGMATEGTTLAVERGTADPFTDDEFRTLGGGFARMIRDLPYEEQKGYQTHYLMIGLELMHRITGREDVAETYRRGVDWFCGFPDTFASDRPLQEHYGGILCRHLGYAFRLTGDRRYLETGLEILQQIIDAQDWSDDPRRRGSIDMNPSNLSLLFFGVPGFLAEVRRNLSW